MTEKLTIATASGGIWLALIIHFGSGLVALVAGFAAIAARKGGKWHRWTGLVFTAAMITSGLFIIGIASYANKPGMVIGGALTAYLVYTALLTVRPGADDRRVNKILAGVALLMAVGILVPSLMVLRRPETATPGIPIFMPIFLGTIALLAAVGDIRMIRSGGIQGSRRIARHLWRMCFGMFIATGSFFFGQAEFIPKPLRIMPILAILGLFPLFVLLYWMWRVRIRQQLRGLTINPGRQ
jgi:hypothetical protein